MLPPVLLLLSDIQVSILTLPHSPLHWHNAKGYFILFIIPNILKDENVPLLLIFSFNWLHFTILYLM